MIFSWQEKNLEKCNLGYEKAMEFGWIFENFVEGLRIWTGLKWVSCWVFEIFTGKAREREREREGNLLSRFETKKHPRKERETSATIYMASGISNLDATTVILDCWRRRL